MSNNFEVIVIGAGAAGLFCAIEAGKRGRKVLVIEREEKAGKKILISGGGRCNFTNIYSSPDRFISDNPHFAISALARYTPQDFISLVKKHDIKYHEKKLGQLFCDGSSKQIVDMLLKECKDAGVEIIYNCKVANISKSDNFILITSHGEFECESLVIASGGISIPKMGATDFGYSIAKKFGLKLTEIKPGLVPLTLHKRELDVFGSLSGVSFDAVVSCNGVSFNESVLFTHRGLSGPAILQISSYWDGGKEIVIDILPGIDIIKEIENNRSAKQLNKFLSLYLSQRFIDKWCEMYFPSRPVNKLSPKDIIILSEKLHNWKIIPSGTEGYEKAEVTKGGIDTDGLSSKTMECKKVKGLYFIGEVVDVTGWLGGYNFQWAWASGYACGNVL
ncbi:MAG: NAD(P)/FAD-dependent oxidoreductase [Ignavibacteriae bacterium]|nr:MAG: NAD(P)/FAD-dependent oxidoreductase [Ignavibacteriota bacterium]